MFFFSKNARTVRDVFNSPKRVGLLHDELSSPCSIHIHGYTEGVSVSLVKDKRAQLYALSLRTRSEASCPRLRMGGEIHETPLYLSVANSSVTNRPTAR